MWYIILIKYILSIHIFTKRSLGTEWLGEFVLSLNFSVYFIVKTLRQNDKKYYKVRFSEYFFLILIIYNKLLNFYYIS